MKKQRFDSINEEIREAFLKAKKDHPERFKNRLNISWSNWMFGIEPLEESAARLARYDVPFIELHGNHYGPDLGYQIETTLDILRQYNVSVSGVCGMFSRDNDLSSNSAIQRQTAIDYIKREIEFTASVGGYYLLVVPGAVGRPKAYDESEFERSVATLQLLGDYFIKYGIKAAIEPIRSAEVSLIHTIEEAKRYIQAVGHPGIGFINGDVYHMQSEETHIASAILEAGSMLANLHLADSNRGALGDGSMDLDTILRALYLIGFNQEGMFITPEPLGPGGDPYPAMFGKTEKRKLDKLVEDSVMYLREREEAILGE